MTTHNDYREAPVSTWLARGRELLADPYTDPEDLEAHAAAAHSEADGIEFGVDLMLSGQRAALTAYFAGGDQAAAEGQ